MKLLRHDETILFTLIGYIHTNCSRDEERLKTIVQAHKARANGEPFRTADEDVKHIISRVSALPLRHKAATIAVVLGLLSCDFIHPPCDEIISVSTEELDLAVSLMAAQNAINHVETLINVACSVGVINSDIVWRLSTNHRTHKMLGWIITQIRGNEALDRALKLLWEDDGGTIDQADFSFLWDLLCGDDGSLVQNLVRIGTLPSAYIDVLVSRLESRPAVARPTRGALISKVCSSNLRNEEKLFLAKLIHTAGLPDTPPPDHPPTDPDLSGPSVTPPPLSPEADSDESPLIRRPRARRVPLTPSDTPDAEAGPSRKRRLHIAAVHNSRRKKARKLPALLRSQKYSEAEIDYIFRYVDRHGRKWVELSAEMKKRFGHQLSRSALGHLYARLEKQVYGSADFTEAFDEFVDEGDEEPDFVCLAMLMNDRFIQSFTPQELERVYHVRY
jgi:hypothetical protein